MSLNSYPTPEKKSRINNENNVEANLNQIKLRINHATLLKTNNKNLSNQ